MDRHAYTQKRSIDPATGSRHVVSTSPTKAASRRARVKLASQRRRVAVPHSHVRRTDARRCSGESNIDRPYHSHEATRPTVLLLRTCL